MNEAYKVCEAYLQLQPFISKYKSEIHLDINTEPKFGSSCVAKEASGYVYGLTGQKPKLNQIVLQRAAARMGLRMEDVIIFSVKSAKISAL